MSKRQAFNATLRTGERVRSIEVHRQRVLLTNEQSSFIETRIAAGLTDTQVTRMFYRAYGRDLSVATVRRRRTA